jgi:hypothetical protein
MKPTQTELRAAALYEQAIAGLQEYYECLNDTEFCITLEASIKVPDTGNDQLDYENVRDQIENQLQLLKKV